MCHLLSNKKSWSSRKSLDLGFERQGLGLEQQGLGLDKKVLVTALVPTSVLKRCRGVFSPLIARLDNISSSQGQFQAQFIACIANEFVVFLSQYADDTQL